MLTQYCSDIPPYLPIWIYIEINGNLNAFETSICNSLCLQERCILDGTLTVNYEQVDTEYRLRHNDLLANIVHRYVITSTRHPIEKRRLTKLTTAVLKKNDMYIIRPQN